MLIRIIFAFLIVIMSGCGPDGSADPLDFISSIIDGGSPVTSSIFSETIITDPAKLDKKSSTCLSECQTEDIANVAFTSPTDLLPATCKVKDFQVFPYQNSYLLFSWGDCLEGNQIYYSRITTNGGIITPAQAIKTNCYLSFSEILGFQSAFDGENVMIAYACRNRNTQNNPYRGFYALIDPTNGQMKSESLFYNDASQWWEINLSYNVAAKTFGLLFRNSFIRIDSRGIQQGGWVNTYLQPTGSRLRTMGGNWYILYTPYSGPTTCSKINANGVLECNQKPLDRSDLQFTSNTKFISKSYTYNGGSYSSPNTTFEIASFNAETCSTSVPQVLGNDAINSDDQLLFTDLISGDVYGVLYEDTIQNTLKLGVLRNALNGKILSLVSVAPAIDLKRAYFFVNGHDITVFFLDSLGVRMNTASVILSH